MQCPSVWITAESWRLTTSSVWPASRSASVSPAPRDEFALKRQRDLAQIRRRYAHRDVRIPRTGCLQRGQQLGVGNARAVHLPVADNEFARHDRLPFGGLPSQHELADVLVR